MLYPPNESTVPVRGKRAFTLMELLVVITIVMILAALLFPALNYTQERAKGAVCLGNAHSMTAAALLWVGEHGDHAYPGFPYSIVPGPSVNWDTELIPTYLPKALRCPSKPANSVNNPMGYDFGWRYAVHQVIGDLGAATAYVPPSRIVIVGEMYYTPTGFWSASHLKYTSDGATTGGIKQSHLGGLNLGFADGHVELVQAPKDPNGNIDWWLSPAAAHDLKTGYFYDITYWHYVIVLHYTTSW